jgi:hypothetical protein
MDRSGCRKIVLLVAVLALALAAGSQVATAQTTDVYTVDYYANANTVGAPDATVRVINPGTTSAVGTGPDAGGIGADLCALIYVFDANQEMSECCGCFVSANALMTLSVNNNLTSNPLLAGRLHTGVIKIVSAAGPVAPAKCDPTNNVAPPTPTPTLRSWATHIQNKVGTTFPETEGESQAAVLGVGEQADLVEDCAALLNLGSGAGLCKCPPNH